MSHKMKIKRDDEVLVVRGKARGATGRVLKVLPSENRVIVERVNFIRKHTRPNPHQQIQGGILEKEAPIRVENLKVICPSCEEPARLGRRRLEDGTGVRYCKRCGAVIE